MEEKKQIRTAYLKLRKKLVRSYSIAASKRICQILKADTLYQNARTIYFYYPMRGEVDLLPLAQQAIAQGKQVGFPKTSGNSMDFYLTESLEDFQEGAFGVMEPKCNIKITKKEPLLLIPGIAFDNNKNRIGYGKGYYDNYIKCYPHGIRIGIAYECQITDTIPVMAFDMPMHKLVTEEKIW